MGPHKLRAATPPDTGRDPRSERFAGQLNSNSTTDRPSRARRAARPSPSTRANVRRINARRPYATMGAADLTIESQALDVTMEGPPT